jgi:hypothetical protein
MRIMRKLLGCLIFVAVVLLWMAIAAHAADFVTLTWTDTNGGKASTNIFRKAEACAAATLPYQKMASVGLGVTTYIDSTVLGGAVYCYQVDAFNAGGEGPLSNTAEATIPLSAPSNAPSTLKATPGHTP